MLDTVKQLALVSRAEFLLPNLGSLIMGLAWGASPPQGFIEIVILVVLSFTIINLSSAIGAQINTLSDYELDSGDERKKELVLALESFGHKRLKIVLGIEFVVTLIVVALFMLVEAKPLLLIMWVVGISLGAFYSARPFRIKARSWMAPISLVLVLAVFPVFFAYLTFTSELNSAFLLALTGLALTVYGVIVPTEIRDYFGDKEMGIETMTVRLGLVRASLVGIILLSLGGILIGTAFFVAFFYGEYPVLSLLIFVVAAADLVVLREFMRLYALAREHSLADQQDAIAHRIIDLSANNPRWIMLVTQTYSLISVVMLVSRFLP